MSSRFMSVITACLGALVMTLSLAGTANAAPGSTNEGAANLCVYGGFTGATSIAVIHTPDGSYAQGNGNYDFLLQPGDCTRDNPPLGWPHAGGVYIPPRWAIRFYDSLDRYIATAARYNMIGCTYIPSHVCEIPTQ
jgi:hypothetical protein